VADRSRPDEVRRFEQFWLIAAALDLATSLRFVTIAAVTGLKLVALHFLWTTATTRWLVERR
jgi:hypothetical protein